MPQRFHYRMRSSAVTVPLVMALVLVGGCSGDGSDEPDPFDDGATAAESAGSIDGAGCDLPITFDTAADWEAESVSSEAAAEFEQAGFTPACEIKGHSAGLIGFVRVWHGTGEPEQALQAYVDDVPGQLEDSESRPVEIAGTDGFEMSYDRIDALDEPNKGRAFAIPADDGVVLVSLSGFDAEEYEGALPAYILARETVEQR